jgi:hypothetical protein
MGRVLKQSPAVGQRVLEEPTPAAGPACVEPLAGWNSWNSGCATAEGRSSGNVQCRVALRRLPDNWRAVDGEADYGIL